MYIPALTGNHKLAAAILIGLLVGFLIVKTELCWRKTIIGCLRLRNGRALKTLLSVMVFGTIFFYFARQSGAVELCAKPTYFWASLIGGVVAGTGLMLCAFTPITALAALGAGRTYAIWPLLGMTLAIPVVALLQNVLAKTIYTLGTPTAESCVVPPVFWSYNNPVLYVAGIGVFLIVLINLTVGDGEN